MFRRESRPRQRLAEARRLLREGKLREAARAFDELAREAEERGLPGGAGELCLEAARCYLKLGDVKAADERGLKALRLLMKAGRVRRVRQLVPRMMAALEKRGLHQEAAKLRQEVESFLASRPVPPGPRVFPRPGLRPLGPPPQPPRFPAKCPNCGAPVKLDEAKRLGPHAIECAYCGSPIEAEKE